MAIVLYLYKVSNRTDKPIEGTVEEVFETYRQKRGDKFFDSHVMCFKRMYAIFDYFEQNSELRICNGKDLAFISKEALEGLLDKLLNTQHPMFGHGFDFNEWVEANYGVEKYAKKMLRSQICRINTMLKYSKSNDKFIILNA